jgi:hypothetical protein
MDICLCRKLKKPLLDLVVRLIKEPSDKNSIWMIICYNLTYSELELSMEVLI